MTERRDIEPIRVPGRWLSSAVVEQIEGTRWYVERGPIQHFRQWLNELHEMLRKERAGLLIPMQWVPGYVGVSRAAVQKRAKSGGLTVFSYVITEHSRTILGREVHRETRQRYDLVPMSECQQWVEILLSQAGEGEWKDDE